MNELIDFVVNMTKEEFAEFMVCLVQSHHGRFKSTRRFRSSFTGFCGVAEGKPFSGFNA